MKEGIKTGRREGQQMLILHLLQNVLGQLTPEIKKRIQQCDGHMLQVIGMHIHQIHNEQDVLKLLIVSCCIVILSDMDKGNDV